MWPRKDFLDLVGVEHPIVQAPMASASTPALVVAVSAAGGLGSLGAARLPPDALRSAIRDIRARTDRPFAVNLFAPTPAAADEGRSKRMSTRLAPHFARLDAGAVHVPTGSAFSFDDQVAVICAERVPVFSFTFNELPPASLDAIRESGARIIGTATTVTEGRALAAAGVDAVVAQGSEAGGHRGTFAVPFERAMIGTIALVPQLVDAVRIPVIAAGGITDARGIVAALTLGASAVQMGTAFIACPESGVAPAWRRALAGAASDSTVMTHVVTGRPARAIENRIVRELSAYAGEIPGFDVQSAMIRPLIVAASQRDDPDYLFLLAGQAAALAREMPAADLVAALVREARDLMARLSRPG